MLNIEIYVKNPKDGKFYPLDQFDDEAINMNFKLKDLNDISKVFSTYSQDFTVPASGNNNKIFNYFFNTELVRTRDRGLEAKLYVNDQLFRVGQVVIKEGQVENFRLLNYKVEFRTVVAQLKEKIGDDLIGDIIGDTLNEDYSIQWDSQSVYDRIVWSTGNEDVLIPLVSNQRVWTYGDSGASDIKQAATGVDKYELRPAIKLSVMLDLLIQHYDLNVDFPLKTAEAFDKLYVWLNGASKDGGDGVDGYNMTTTQLIFNQAFNPYLSSSKYFFDVTTTPEGYLRVTDTGASFNASRNFIFVPELLNIKNPETGATYDKGAKMILTQIETGETQIIDSSIWSTTMQFKFGIGQKTAGTVRTYKLDVEFDDAITFDNVYCTTSATLSFSEGLSQNALLSINNPGATPIADYNIKYALGNWKVVDLFTSIFKMFNIRVVEDFNNNSMTWLTPDEFYSNAEVIDINKYTDVIKYTIQPSPNYKDIVFKHTNEDYFRNTEYKKLVNKDYGSEIYKSDDKSLTESYQVETKFSIMNWFIMNSINMKTSYGFSQPDSPKEPSVPTIMYAQGFEIIRTDDDSMNAEIRFKIPSPSNPGFTNQLARYIKFGNQSSSNPDTYQSSLTFDIDIEPSSNTPMLKSLYNNYYRVDIERLYQPNSNYYNFEGYLSLEGVLAFDMRNRLIIEDNVYTIEEASIDITTGKFKMKLLNIIGDIFSDNEFPPTPQPQTFLANGGVFKITGAVNTGSYTTDEISHYEIQYRLQGTNTWVTGLNLPYVPFVSQTWSIDPVSSTGMYDVRCRTVAPSPNPNASEWIYAYNVNVISNIVFIPVSGLIDDSLVERGPCNRFSPVSGLSNNRRVYFDVESLDLITNGTNVYLDEELTTHYTPSNLESLSLTSVDYTQYQAIEINNDGVVRETFPCFRLPTRAVIANKAYVDTEVLVMDEWNIAPKLNVVVDSQFRLGSKFFTDIDLTNQLEEIALFEGRYMMVKFEDDDSDEDVRYIKIQDGVISELPIPISK